MGLAHVIDPEERDWFRRCRRSWDFGSPNRQNLEPRAPAGGADVLGAVRQAMAVWYFPGMWEWPRAVVEPRALQAFDEAALRLTAPKDAVEPLRATLERYFAWAQTVDAFTPVRVEADFETGIPDARAPGHELVDGDGRPVRYHDRIHALVVDASDAYWVVEHRLTDGPWADRDELLLAERPVTAAWGWEQFYLGMEFAGTVHNELRLDAGQWADDEVRGAGVARHPRSRDWARSRAAARRESAEEAAAAAEVAANDFRVQAGGDGFRRTWVRRSRAEINDIGNRLSAEALEMLDPGLRLYPTPMPEHCRRCDYRPPCLALNEGRDVTSVVAEGYRRRGPEKPQEGRLGGSTWSMNRGAAPPPQWRSPRMPPS